MEKQPVQTRKQFCDVYLMPKLGDCYKHYLWLKYKRIKIYVLHRENGSLDLVLSHYDFLAVLNVTCWFHLSGSPQEIEGAVFPSSSGLCESLRQLQQKRVFHHSPIRSICLWQLFQFGPCLWTDEAFFQPFFHKFVSVIISSAFLDF